ncbi:coiled-coil domain-containing protein 92-like [Dendronephthya gigantea]|uniref:coiled-coil domain-containing protein 92-like n=1 Tax=Dendronephthya gigantea TaxID=151771 RepID=UPI00106C813F|nr:coiled-coil domain-containing protein 92-like [Dendronephthya gigantea]
MSNQRVQLQNAESSVLFLQKQHAKTLEGLYSEISKLQKKCGELTFQMAMNSTTLTSEEESFRDRSLKVEKELERKSEEIAELNKRLEGKTKHNALLEKNFRQMQEMFDESIRTKDRQIAALTSELDSNAGNTAYLAKQLHDSKVAYAELSDRINMNFAERPIISPAPPGEKAPTGNRRRYIRKVIASNGNVNIESVDSLNPTTQKMLLNVKTAKSNENFPTRSIRRSPTVPTTNRQGARSFNEMPVNQSRNVPEDYTDFLKTGSKPEPKLVYKPVPNPLPPIVNGVEENGVQVPYKVHRSRGQEPGIVDEIIVSPLNSPDKSWHQGSNQYDPVS